MKVGREKKIQFNIVNWLRQNHPDIPFMASFNEQQASPMWRQIGQKMGIKKGQSDLFFPKGSGVFKGFWLELKTETGTATIEQIKFIEDMIDLGYHGYIAYGYEDAELAILHFYLLDK